MTYQEEVKGDVKVSRELREKVLNYIIESWDDLKTTEKDYIVNGIINHNEDMVLSEFNSKNGLSVEEDNYVRF